MITSNLQIIRYSFSHRLVCVTVDKKYSHKYIYCNNLNNINKKKIVTALLHKMVIVNNN